MNFIGIDGSAASGKFGFGISSKTIRISGPVKPHIVTGISYPTVCYDTSTHQPATNNRGELLAMLYCLHYIEQSGLYKHTIVGDSQYVLKTLNEWYPTRLMKHTEREILNYDLISLAYNKYMELRNSGYEITLLWQKAHLTKAQFNKLSTEGKMLATLNDDADSLALNGYKYDKPTIL